MLSVKMPRKDVVKLVEVPVPTPAKGEVLVKVKASALCRSDMHVLHRVMFDLCGDSEDYMISPGHEPSGVVEALGEGVTKVKVGDRVALFLAIGCGHCRHCKEGNIVLCPDLKMISRDRDGAHADYLTIPEECCLPMPDDMDFVTAALSTDVGGTLYTACKRLGVTKDTSVAIFGVGPMGMGGHYRKRAGCEGHCGGRKPRAACLRAGKRRTVRSGLHEGKRGRAHTGADR